MSGEGLFGFGLGYMNGSTLYHVSAYDATGALSCLTGGPFLTFFHDLLS